jgi:hypothetical protein
MDYKVDHGHFYIVYKNQDPEKALLIDKCRGGSKYPIELLEKFTPEMINCKFDYYNTADGICYTEDYTLLINACDRNVVSNIKQINCLIEKGAELTHTYYKHKKPRSCLINLQNNLDHLEFNQDKEAIELLIKRFEQYEEDIKKPNKICRNI